MQQKSRRVNKNNTITVKKVFFSVFIGGRLRSRSFLILLFQIIKADRKGFKNVREICFLQPGWAGQTVFSYKLLGKLICLARPSLNKFFCLNIKNMSPKLFFPERLGR